ncbi:hypothetical protein C3489_35595 [Streptomyces sp. Ru71]|uniref:hypothetical protein n=1 Tax=Streptomyces sp. Ru71 TaxID=2080746 RepID=UPI000CDD6771|nr:hypothetical protein [Streptomyces sp. Ru71]POX44826.1 hypothetical protein C3489_35595 [Streptomyces sp. Ru71]
MSWPARALCALYVLTSAGLALTALLEFGRGPAWAGCLFSASSLVPLIAVVRETERPGLDSGPAMPAGADGTEALVRAELGAACCERWWTSLGTAHDTSCRHRTHRSSAA